MGLSELTLALMRNRKESWMTDTCDLLEPAHGTDSLGSPSLAYLPAATGVKCRVITAGDRNRPMVEDYGDAETIVQRYRLSLPWDTSISTGWRVVYADRVYEVAAVSDNLTDRDEVQCVITRVRE